MKKKTKWSHIIYIAGVIALIIGAIDPLEGSVVVVTGSAFVALATYLSHDRHRKIFLLSFIMIAIGVGFMFYFSSLGGFDEGARLSWWWGSLILPYPAGWLMSIILLIKRVLAEQKQKVI